MPRIRPALAVAAALAWTVAPSCASERPADELAPPADAAPPVTGSHIPPNAAPPVPPPKPSGGPDAPHAELTPEITAEQVLTRIAYLASEELEGRESGTPGGTAAEEYVAGELKRFGLEPLGGARESPFLDVPMPSRPPLVAQCFLAAAFADGAPYRSTPVDGSMPFAFSAGGTATGPLVFAGYGLKSAEYDDWKDIDARGKVAIILRHGPRETDKTSPWFARGTRMKEMSFLQKAKNAASAGAVAVILVNDLHHGGDALPTSAADEAAPIPLIAVSRATANRLLRPVGKELMNFEHMIDADLGARSCDVPGVTVTVSAALGEAKGRDVVFVRRGTDPALAGEAVVLGAHMDHVGYGLFGGDPADAGQIHNGADDNASGTAAMLEIAEALAAGPPMKRSVIFAGWCGEEKGLIGSEYWVNHPTWPLKDVITNVNFDMVGRYRTGDDEPRLQIEGGVTGTGLDVIALPIAKEHGLIAWISWEAWEQSDHFSFYAKKVPALFIHTGLHPDYHRPGDDWWKINAKGEAQIAQMGADLVRAIADMPARPAFHPKPPRPVIGVQMGDAENDGGVVLAVVPPGMPANAAGLVARDVITEFDGVKIRNSGDLAAVIAKHKPGDVVDVVYRRGAETKTTKITIAGR